MRRGPSTTQAQTAAILSMRAEGISCREIAAKLDIGEGRVWACNRKAGIAGKYRARGAHYAPWLRKPTLNRAIEEYGAVTVELGADGGFIATLADKWTGMEQETVVGAIRSAVEAVGC